MNNPFKLRKRVFSHYETVCQTCGLGAYFRHTTDHAPVWITKTKYRHIVFKEETLENTLVSITNHYKFVAEELEKGLL